MPELPEVNTVRKGFAKVALHDRITKVDVHDDKILRNVTVAGFKKALTGQMFIDTYRQGKYFFGKLDSAKYILFHLGMTGDLVYYHSPDDQPKYERFNIQLKSGLILGYDDLRKFSDIRVIENLETYLAEINLGPDALLISRQDFKNLYLGKKTPLKSILMNQKLVAGVGNLYADEICFQAKIHPGSTAGALSGKQLNLLYKLMQSILQYACDQDAYYKVYPDNWFWEWRSDEGRQIKGKGKVAKSTIAGRTTYFVEGYQKLIS